MSKILVIDDEKHIQELLKFNLEMANYRVICAGDGNSGLEIAKIEVPNLILLDWMLPEMSGIELLKIIRSDETLFNIPIIMLTAKNMEDDKIEGLDNGADDFITKPFSIKELKARIKTVLRRYRVSEDKKTSDVELLFDNIVLNTEKMEVLKDGIKVDLTLKEFEILKLFMQNIGRVITREELLEKVWGYDFFGETRTVDVHIRYLRKKLGDESGNKKLIETIRGIGYKFNS